MVVFSKILYKKFGGGVWGTRLGSDIPKRGMNKTRPPNARSNRLGDALETRLEML
jgi:hypothetical protein